MAARSRSPARSVFFAPPPEPLQGTAQGRPADPHPAAALGQLLPVFIQRAIVALGHQRPQYSLARRIDPPRPTAAMRLGTAPPVRARLLTPQIHRRETNAKALGRQRRRQTGFPSRNTRSRRPAE
jgi:hypothetical protein